MKKHIFKFSFALLLLFTLGACSSYKYNTTRVQNLDFRQYRTYAWLPPVDSMSKSYFDGDIARANILDAANAELESRGLRHDKEAPDLLFRYVAIVNNKSRPVYAHPYSAWGPWGFYDPWFYRPSVAVGKEKYRYGHIIIEAIERETNSVIWQARGSGEIRSPEKSINDLPKVVKGVLKELPLKR